jgi:hypothetical protein
MVGLAGKGSEVDSSFVESEEVSFSSSAGRGVEDVDGVGIASGIDSSADGTSVLVVGSFASVGRDIKSVDVGVCG